MKNVNHHSEKNSAASLPYQSRGEEIANSITHGIGAMLSIAALVILVVFSSLKGDAWRIVSLSIYGTTLFLLYLASTLYHSFSNIQLKQFFRFLDHSSIYLLIAGSYTPILLVLLRGPWGWTLFGIVWALAISGIVAKVFFTGRYGFISGILYIAMGWIVVVAYKEVMQSIPHGLWIWLLVGGILYTCGTIFYAWNKLPYNHMIWHLFVLGGSASHFFGMLFYLTSLTN